MKLGKLLFAFASFISLSFSNAFAGGPYTETFESATTGRPTSFTNNGQLFSITSNDCTNGGIFGIYIPGGSWTLCGGGTQTSGSGGFGVGTSCTSGSCTGTSDKFIDNGSASGTNQKYSIKTSGTLFNVNNLQVYVSTDNGSNPTSAGVIFRGKRAGVTIYTITKSSGLNTLFTSNNGFTYIDFSTEGGVNNSNYNIDQLEIEGTNNENYIAIDNFTWSTQSPPVVVTAAATAVSYTTATLNGTANDNAFATTVSFDYGTSPTLSTFTTTAATTGGSITANTGNTAAALNLTGLASGTTYYFRIRASNSVGTTLGPILNFTTLSCTAVSASINSQTNITCNGSNNGSASVSASGGSGFTYAWSNGSTAVTASSLSAITYTVTVTNSCSSTATTTATITQPSALSLTMLSQTNIACNGGSNGAASVNAATGGAGGYAYNWTPGNPTGDGTTSVTGLTVGVWTVQVTDANSCTKTASFNITQPSAIALTGASQTNISCNGGSNGAASVNAATGGASGFVYNWTPGNPTGDGTVSVTGLTVGVWTCSATDANSCIATYTVNITQPAAITLTGSSSTNISCNGGSNGAAAVNSATGGAGGFTYNWTPGNPTGDGTVSVTGLTAGVWTCSATDANSCVATYTVNITQPTAIAASISGQTNIACKGNSTGSASVGATGGAGTLTYNWSNGSTGLTATNLSATTYTVTVSDGNGCTKSTNVTLTQPSTGVAVSISGQTNVLCYGDATGFAAAIAIGGSGPYSYVWSNGNTNSNVSGLNGAATYTVTVTDASSCSNTTVATITQPSAALSGLMSLPDNVSCHGGSDGKVIISVGGGTGSLTYSWAPSGGSGTVASGLPAATYTCYVTDANGCTFVKTATVTEPAALTASTSVANNVSCFGGSTGMVSVSAAGGTSPFTYVWSNSATASTASGLASGTYYVTVTDSKSCLTTSSVDVSQPSTAVTVSIVSQTDVLCGGNATGSASAISGGGTGAINYNWSTGGTNVSLSGLAAAAYTLTVTDANVCSATTVVTITAPPVLSLSLTSQTNVSCFGGNNGSAHVTELGGTPGYSYSWSNGFTTAGLTSLIAKSYSCTVTDGNGCTSTTVATITEPPVLSSSGTVQSDVTCASMNDGAVFISATGGTPAYSYLWSSGATTAISTGLVAGTYTATVTDANGCTVTETATVASPSSPVVSIASHTNELCNGNSNGSATAVASGGVGSLTYLWSTGNTTLTVSGLAAAAYEITVTDFNGCTTTATVTITEPVVLSVGVTASVNPVCPGANSDLTANVSGGTSAYTYTWSVGSVTSLQTVNPYVDTPYTLTVTDANGCSATTVETVNVQVCTTGIQSASNNGKDVSVYPNPTNGDFSINTNNTVADLITVSDVLGKVLFSVKPSTSIVTMSLDGQSNGVYFVRIIQQNDQHVIKLMKQQ